METPEKIVKLKGGWINLLHLALFILRLGDFAGYKFLAIDALRARWLLRRLWPLSSHDNVVIYAATTDRTSKFKCTCMRSMITRHEHNFSRREQRMISRPDTLLKTNRFKEVLIQLVCKHSSIGQSVKCYTAKFVYQCKSKPCNSVCTFVSNCLSLNTLWK